MSDCISNNDHVDRRAGRKAIDCLSWRVSGFLVFVLVSGCGSSELADLDPGIFASKPTYSGSVGAILHRHCTACHNSDGIRLGGVELDRYESAHSNRVRSACVAVSGDLVERFSDELRPQLADRAGMRQPCGSWSVYSMPTGALPPLTRAEQVTLLRWVETGAPQ